MKFLDLFPLTEIVEVLEANEVPRPVTLRYFFYIIKNILSINRATTTR